MERFEAAIAEAESGKTLIERCAAAGGGNKTVLLFPEYDPEVLDIAFRYIDRYLRSFDCAVVIAAFDIEAMRRHTPKPLHICRVSEEEMRGALRYASMLNTTEQYEAVGTISIISMRTPSTQQADRLAGVKGVTLEMIVARGLFGLAGGLS